MAGQCGPSNLNVKVIGVGAAGASALYRLSREPFAGLDLIAIDICRAHLDSAGIPNSLCIELPASADPHCESGAELTRVAAIERTADILNLVEGADLVIILAELGGPASTGIPPVVAAIAAEASARTVAFVTATEAFERRTVERIERGIEDLMRVTPLVQIPLVDRPRSAWLPDEILAQSARCLLYPLLRPDACLSRVRLIDLGLSFQPGKRGAVAVGSAHGDIARAIGAALGDEGLLLGGRPVARAARVWMLIEARDITPGEVQRGLSIIYETVPADCRVVCAISNDERMGESLRVTILGCGYEHLEPSPDPRLATEQSERRAVRILGELLPDQAEQYRKQKFIDVRSSHHKGRVYRLQSGRRTTIFCNGEPAGCACLTLRGLQFPPTDRVLAEYFLIRGDEKRYMRTANITWERAPRPRSASILRWILFALMVMVMNLALNRLLQ